MLNSVYDWFMTNNRRDHLRSAERVELGLTDTTMLANVSTQDAYWAFRYVDNIVKKAEKVELNEKRAEIRERQDNQKGSLDSRIQGFLRSAGIDKDIQTGYGQDMPKRRVEASKDAKMSAEEITEENKEENTEENKDSEEKPGEAQAETSENSEKDVSKSKKTTPRRININDLEFNDRAEAKRALLNFEPSFLQRPRKMNQFVGLPSRLTSSNIFRPNISTVTTALLATTYAPDDITPRRINYSELDASNSHKLLDLAIAVKNADLLALAEKACGMYAQPLNVDLRIRYISFKEDMLRNPGKLR
jgi:hypothetical protein